MNTVELLAASPVVLSPGHVSGDKCGQAAILRALTSISDLMEIATWFACIESKAITLKICRASYCRFSLCAHTKARQQKIKLNGARRKFSEKEVAIENLANKIPVM